MELKDCDISHSRRLHGAEVNPSAGHCLSHALCLPLSRACVLCVRAVCECRLGSRIHLAALCVGGLCWLGTALFAAPATVVSSDLGDPGRYS